MYMDETQSQDQAFPTEGNPQDVFTFDEQPTTASSPEETVTKETPSSSPDEKTDDVVTATNDVSEPEEQRVPYSRFKKKVDEAEQAIETIRHLESRLAALEDSRRETKSDDVEVPAEWTKLYGNSDAAKEAWKIQLSREQKLREDSVREAIAYLKQTQEEEKLAEQENEETLDEYISTLKQSYGKPFTAKVEEEILTIVDEFSPVGEDGKYASLISPDKALEIYNLRSAQRTTATAKARERVAALTTGSSEGDADSSSDTPFRRGWDNWREAL